MSKKLTYAEVKTFIEIESKSNCKLISDTYKGYKDKLKIQCSCGIEFETTYDCFKSGNKRQCDRPGCRSYYR
jgi:hypothetical protein